MPNNFGNDNEVRCSFCGKPQSQAKRLISGNGVYICDECVELCMDIIADEDSLHRGRPQPKNKPRAEMVLPKPQETETVRFGGTIRQFWDGGRLHVVPEGATEVLAIPCDMEIAGYGTNHVNTLRLWDAKSPVPLDMSLFSRGEYLRAQEQHAMAETIAKVLYPEDNHPEGKSLRLKQQYFFVSATMQSIVRKHIEVYGTAENFHEKNVIQINDTHPALVIPELMRILMDDAGLDWDTSWHITTHSVAYTNHTVLAEALERWPQELMQSLLPRIWLILTEIALIHI